MEYTLIRALDRDTNTVVIRVVDCETGNLLFAAKTRSKVEEFLTRHKRFCDRHSVVHKGYCGNCKFDFRRYPIFN